MKLLKCKICLGEVDLVGDHHSIERKTQCRKCGFSSTPKPVGTGPGEPEIIRIHGRRGPHSL